MSRNIERSKRGAALNFAVRVHYVYHSWFLVLAAEAPLLLSRMVEARAGLTALISTHTHHNSPVTLLEQAARNKSELNVTSRHAGPPTLALSLRCKTPSEQFPLVILATLLLFAIAQRKRECKMQGNLVNLY
jgi:hypothetical protein